MNQKYFALFTAATLAASSLAVRADNKSETTTVADPNVPAVTTNNEQSPYADDIRRVLARVTEDAVKGNAKDVADNFTTASQSQFSRSGKHLTGPNAHADKNDNNNTLNNAATGTGISTPAAVNNDTSSDRAAIKSAEDQLKQTSKQLTDAWKAKYNHDFNIDHKNEPMVYAAPTFQITKGDMTNTGQTAAAHVNATVDNKSTDDRSTLDKVTDKLTGHSDAATGTDLENRMATVTAQESHGAPTLSLTLVNEGTFGNRWHIQAPVGLDLRTLTMNLNHHLQMVLDMKDQWPADENQAYMAVSHHVLAALAQPMTQATGNANTNNAQPAGYNPTPQR